MTDIQNLILAFIQLFLQYVWIANLFFIIVIIMVERKNPLYTILWIFLLAVIQYFGFFFYLYFGLTFKKKRVANRIYNLKKLRSKEKKFFKNYAELKRWNGLITYLETSSQNDLASNNKVELFFEGKDFFEDLKKEIAQAKNYINMEYFIFQFDEIGKEIANLLIERADAGIEVNILIDGVNKANGKLARYFKNSKVNLHFFFRTYIPIFNIRINYRDHRKITIIDGNVAFIGGMNIGDLYIREEEKKPYTAEDVIQVRRIVESMERYAEQYDKEKEKNKNKK